jgi:hypothetical protein
MQIVVVLRWNDTSSDNDYITLFKVIKIIIESGGIMRNCINKKNIKLSRSVELLEPLDQLRHEGLVASAERANTNNVAIRVDRLVRHFFRSLNKRNL